MPLALWSICAYQPHVFVSSDRLGWQSAHGAEWHPSTSCIRSTLELCGAMKSFLKLRLQLLILLHQTLYCLYLCRKSVTLFVRRCLIRFRLFQSERELVAKQGRNWRLCVLNNECVEALKVFNYIHRVLTPNSNIRTKLICNDKFKLQAAGLHGQGSTVGIIGFKSIQDPQFSDHSRPSHSTIAVETGGRTLFLASLLTQPQIKLYQPHIDVS